MTRPEIVDFCKVLNAIYVEPDLADTVFRIKEKFSDYTTNAPFPHKILQLVTGAENRGWLPKLVEAVVNDRAHSRELIEFLVKYPHLKPAAIPSTGDPFDTLFLFGGRCFIGRSQLRHFLRRMGTPKDRKVLVVTSDQSRVGKTYSRELVTYLCLHSSPSDMVCVDLDHRDYDPGTLARAISEQRLGALSGSPFPRRQKQYVRWNEQLVDWIIPLTADTMTIKDWWIVLDGFIEPSESMQDFIEQLAERIKGLMRFRLMLINYTKPLHVRVNYWVLKDHVKPLSRGDVKDFLAEVHRQKHGVPPLDTQLNEYVDGCYARRDAYASVYSGLAKDDHSFLNMAADDSASAI